MNFSEKDIAENRNLALLSYLSFLFIIPLYLKNNSDFAKFHAKQGRNLFVFQILVLIFNSLNNYVLQNFLPLPVFIALGFISTVLVILVFSLAVLGVVKVVKGEASRLPIIGNFAK